MTATTHRQSPIAPPDLGVPTQAAVRGPWKTHGNDGAAVAIRLNEPDAEPAPGTTLVRRRLRASDPHALLSRHRQRVGQSVIGGGQPRVQRVKSVNKVNVNSGPQLNHPQGPLKMLVRLVLLRYQNMSARYYKACGRATSCCDPAKCAEGEYSKRDVPPV